MSQLNAVPRATATAESSDLVSAESTLNKLLFEIQHAAEETGERCDRPPGLLSLAVVPSSYQCKSARPALQASMLPSPGAQAHLLRKRNGWPAPHRAARA
jgi:hypothetical protein